MNYVVYDPASGEITVSGIATIPDAQGLGIVLENAAGANGTHYVSDGALVAYTTAQVTAKAAMPPYYSTWSNTTFSWTDARSLADAQTQTWASIVAARDANLAAGFVWGGSMFDSDDVSQQRIQGAVQLATLSAAAGQPFSITWTLFDNTTRILAGSDMISVGIALGTFVQNVFAAGVALREQVNVTTANSQLIGLVWATIS